MRAELKNAIDMALRLAQATPEETAAVRAALSGPATTAARDALLTSKAAAAAMDSCIGTLFRMEKRGILHAVRRGKRNLRWRKSEIDRVAMLGAEVAT